MADAADDLDVKRRDAVMWITLNRPHARNALTEAMYDRLRKVCLAVNEDPTVRVLVITGAGGKAFASGTDLRELREMNSREAVLRHDARTASAIDALETVRVPTIAAIAGYCTGAAAVLAAVCDLRIAAPSARYGFHSARSLGNCLSMPNYSRLVFVMGAARVKDLLMTARLIEGLELVESRIVNEIVPTDDDLLPRASQLAAQLVSHAPLSMWATKESLRRIRVNMLPSGNDKDLLLQCYLSADFREGIEAYFAKRPPEWSGR